MNNLCLLRMRKTKKLLYVPGLISLIGIIIALPSFYKKNVVAKEYCLPLFVPSDKHRSNEFEYIFSKYYLEKVISKKRKIRFMLDENKEGNYLKMQMIRYEALKLKYTEDTSTVVLLTLSDSISYGEYVSLLDMCNYDGHKRFASWDNKFVIFGEWPKVKKQATDTIQLFRCGYTQMIKPAIRPGFFELLNKEINNLY